MPYSQMANALSRIAVVEVLRGLVDAGVLLPAVAERAGDRVATEVDQAGI